MKTLFTLLALTYSPSAFAIADFSGHWVANSGKVSSNIGLSSNCSRVEIIIEQSETALLTKKYKATCQLFGTEWGPVKEDINGSQVLEDGVVIGSISEDTLLTLVKSGTAEYAFNLKLVKDANGVLTLKSYYGVRNSTGAMVTEADLHKTSN